VQAAILRLIHVANLNLPCDALSHPQSLCKRQFFRYSRGSYLQSSRCSQRSASHVDASRQRKSSSDTFVIGSAAVPDEAFCAPRAIARRRSQSACRRSVFRDALGGAGESL